MFYQNKLDEAISTYEEGIKIDPSNKALVDDLKAAESKKNQSEESP